MSACCVCVVKFYLNTLFYLIDVSFTTGVVKSRFLGNEVDKNILWRENEIEITRRQHCEVNYLCQDIVCVNCVVFIPGSLLVF